MFTFTLSKYRSSEERKEIEISEKDRSCLTKITTLPLVCEPLGEREPDRERVQLPSRESWNPER